MLAAAMLWLLGHLLALALAERAFLAIAILSNAPNLEHRQAIRDSWLQAKDRNTRAAFIVGKSADAEINAQVKEEAKRHKDILILEDHLESYRGIVVKTRAAFLWAFADSGCDFMLKCDDDSYVHINSLIEDLRELVASNPQAEHLYMGDFRLETAAIRDPTNKYWVSHEEWPETHYPLFACGCGYVIGKGVGQYLLSPEGRKVMDFMLPIEDVTVGIWMDKLNRAMNRTVEYKIDLRFVPSKDFGWRPGVDLVWHELKPQEMLDTWRNSDTLRLRSEL